MFRPLPSSGNYYSSHFSTLLHETLSRDLIFAPSVKKSSFLHWQNNSYLRPILNYTSLKTLLPTVYTKEPPVDESAMRQITNTHDFIQFHTERATGRWLTWIVLQLCPRCCLRGRIDSMKRHDRANPKQQKHQRLLDTHVRNVVRLYFCYMSVSSSYILFLEE